MLSASKLSKLAVVATLALGVASCDEDSTDRGPMVKVRVNPDNILVERGTIRLYHLEGVYRDGSYEVLTSGVTWESLDPAIATIAADGLVSGISVGEARIEGTYGRFADTTIVNVTPGLDFVQFSPSSVIKGFSADYSVLAIMEDRSLFDVADEVVIDVSDEAIVEVDDGVVTGLAPGTATITVTYRDTEYTTEFVVVDANVTAIEIDTDPEMYIGYRGRVTATGTLDRAVHGSTTIDLSFLVTWALADTTHGAINSSGDYVAFIATNTGAESDADPGQVELTAKFKQLATSTELTDTAVLHIKPRDVKLTSIQFVPPQVLRGTWSTMSVVGTFEKVASGGNTFDSTREVSDDMDFSTNLESVVIIDGNKVKGRILGQAVVYVDGYENVDADEDENPDGVAYVTVVEPTIVSASVTFDDPAISVGSEMWATLNATTTTGAFQPLVTWVSADPDVAIVHNGPDYGGLVVGLSASATPATIEAWVRGQKVAEANITVTAAP